VKSGSPSDPYVPALDCIGGASAARLADTLQDGCQMVCFGCMAGLYNAVENS
jgi:hypothetical protein